MSNFANVQNDVNPCLRMVEGIFSLERHIYDMIIQPNSAVCFWRNKKIVTYIHIFITKTCLFKYTEIFTNKK